MVVGALARSVPLRLFKKSKAGFGFLFTIWWGRIVQALTVYKEDILERLDRAIMEA
ncbi:hypothetical protein IJH72_01490 [Candidatus Saccharibacteria bacterium]|nr:hypothetical protein [Candidatus Saccharibacteria bacterium]